MLDTKISLYFVTEGGRGRSAPFLLTFFYLSYKMSFSPLKIFLKSNVMFASIPVTINLTIRETHQLTLKVQCGSCVWDIVTISVLLGDYCHKEFVKPFAGLNLIFLGSLRASPPLAGIGIEVENFYFLKFFTIFLIKL